jgi:hypothetical protein
MNADKAIFPLTKFCANITLKIQAKAASNCHVTLFALATLGDARKLGLFLLVSLGQGK